MSDYTQIVDYSAKDALAKGNPSKKILGSEIDAELAAIATAIATKLDEGGGNVTSVGTLTVASQPVCAVESGEFTPTWGGFSSDPTGDWSYHIFRFGSSGDGRALVVLCPQFNASPSGTSNATTMTITNLPSALQPNSAIEAPVNLIDNGGAVAGRARFAASATLTFNLHGSSFTGSGTKGVQPGQTICYMLNNGG